MDLKFVIGQNPFYYGGRQKFYLSISANFADIFRGSDFFELYRYIIYWGPSNQGRPDIFDRFVSFPADLFCVRHLAHLRIPPLVLHEADEQGKICKRGKWQVANNAEALRMSMIFLILQHQISFCSGKLTIFLVGWSMEAFSSSTGIMSRIVRPTGQSRILFFRKTRIK